MAPRALFKEMLSATKDVYLGAWGKEIIESKDARRRLYSRIEEGKEESGIDSDVDERLERLRRLLSAIDASVENCGPLAAESSYSIPFKRLFEEKVRRMPDADPSSASLAGILRDLAGEKTQHENRTDVYRAIDRRQCSEELKDDLRTFVDTITNQLVAESLGLRERYHSAYRGVGSLHAREGENLERGGVVRLNEQDIKRLDDLKFEWRDIEVVAPGPKEVRDASGVRTALRKLAEQYRNRTLTVPISEEAGQELGKALFTVAVAAAATGSAAATADMFVFGGWFGVMLFGVVAAAIGGAAGLGGPRWIGHRRQAKATEVLTSLHSKISPPKKSIW